MKIINKLNKKIMNKLNKKKGKFQIQASDLTDFRI